MDLTALNTTEGLTSVNGSGSTTIVYQRQIVEVPVEVPVKYNVTKSIITSNL